MDPSLDSWINLYVFSTGRRLYALRQMLAVARARSFDRLAGHLDAAIASDERTLALEQTRAADPGGAESAAATRAADVRLDRAVAGFRDALAAAASGLAPDGPLARHARALLHAAFPNGTRGYTQAAYVEEVEMVTALVGRLRTAPLAEQVASLGFGAWIDELDRATAGLREALATAPPEVVRLGDLRSAQAEGQGNLRIAVAMVLGHFPFSNGDDAAARAALLGPIDAQQAAIRSHYRARRRVPDVNPETGEEQLDASVPTDETPLEPAA